MDDKDGPWNVNERLKTYKSKKEKEINGPALRERCELMGGGSVGEIDEHAVREWCGLMGGGIWGRISMGLRRR